MLRATLSIALVVALACVWGLPVVHGSQEGAGQGSCMVRWLQHYSPRTGLADAQRKARVFLRIPPPIDERNAKSQDLLPLSFVLGNMSNAVGFVDCLTRQTPRCQGSPACHNGGRCVHRLVVSVKRYMCDCPASTTGLYCEEMVTACASMPCKNGATCHESENGALMRCECAPFFNGPSCENRWVSPEELTAMAGTVNRLALESQRQSDKTAQALSSQMNTINTFLRRLESKMTTSMESVESREAKMQTRLETMLTEKVSQMQDKLSTMVSSQISDLRAGLPPGPQGPPGLPGNTGPKGRAGSPGQAGPKGPKGSSGQRGPQGPTGLKGSTGSPGIGIKGQRGPSGSRGQRGSTGAKGSTGPRGPPGLRGANGRTGARGPKGDPGQSVNPLHPPVYPCLSGYNCNCFGCNRNPRR
ncbi:uncharacterized protein LOC135826475 isoform X7 [Sycon ciliatum]|uniref:uncharacterized protein LOC135826475 isoform X7 n=1 Tax=Sycon ciliatum TaxID=27933 RepID=UPI0031F69E2F